MSNLIRSEIIKGRRTFGRKSVVAFPLAVSLLAIFLMGGRLTQVGAYNWWYTLLLPACLSLMSMNIVDAEKRSEFSNILFLPISKDKLWRAKIITLSLYILVANLFVFVFTTLSSLFFGQDYSTWRGLLAALALTATVAWQIPLAMFLAARFHSFIPFIITMALNIVCISQPIAGGTLWVIPFAIPARLMAPIIGINPNGVPLEATSPLQNNDVILPGILITAALYVLLTYITSKWFERWGD